MNSYKYGTPEYKISESIKSLQESLNEILKLKSEIGQIAPIKQITLSGKRYADIQSYYKGWSFDKTQRNHIDNVVKYARSYIEDELSKIEQIHKENIPAIENNIKLREKIKDIFKVLGISESYNTYEYKTNRSSTKTAISHKAGYIQDIERCILINDNYYSEIKAFNEFKIKVDKWAEQHYKEIEKIEKEQNEKDKEIRRVALAMGLAKNWNISYETNKELISKVEEKSLEEYIKNNYPDGTVLDQSSCNYCSEWTVGEHRCRCGNRRMNLTVEGNFIDGYNACVEGY